MTRWKPKTKKKRLVYEEYPVPHGWKPAHILNRKLFKVDKKKDPLKFGFRLGIDEVDIPKGWYQTCTACPHSYAKIVRIGRRYLYGHLRARGCPFRIEIIRLKRGWQSRDSGAWAETVWKHEPIEQEKDNPPIRSMKLVNRQFSRMVKEHDGLLREM